MAVVSPGGGGSNDHDGTMDVGIDVGDLSSYHSVRDGGGGGGGNGIAPSFPVVGRGRLCACQRGKTSLKITTASTSNPNTTPPLAERFYFFLDNVMVATVTPSSSYF